MVTVVRDLLRRSLPVLLALLMAGFVTPASGGGASSGPASGAAAPAAAAPAAAGSAARHGVAVVHFDHSAAPIAETEPTAPADVAAAVVPAGSAPLPGQDTAGAHGSRGPPALA